MSQAPSPRRPILKPRFTADALTAYLVGYDRSFRTRWLLLMTLGLVVTLFGPVAIGSIIWFAQFSDRHIGETRSWLDVVVTTGAIVIPIQFLLERLTRGKLLESMAESLGESSSPLTYMVRGRATVGIVFVEACLWGPRIFNAGWKRIRGLSLQGRASRATAGKILESLLQRDGGITTADAMVASGTLDDNAFGDALGYLMFLDFVDLSKTGDRVWASSDARRAIEKTLR
jgi:hypothetical protein